MLGFWLLPFGVDSSLKKQVGGNCLNGANETWLKHYA